MKSTKRFNRYSIEDQMERFNLSKEQAEEKVKKIKHQNSESSKNKMNVEWQMERFNLSKEQAEEKIKRISNSYSTYQKTINVEWQMERFNLSKEQAEEKIKRIKNEKSSILSKLKNNDYEKFLTINPNNKEHWIKKGFSLEDATIKARQFTKENCQNMRNTYEQIREENPGIHKNYNSACLEYWQNQGYTIEESIELRSKRQSTFSLEICVEKYGTEIGFQIWKERNENWSIKIEEKYQNGEFSRIPKNPLSTSFSNKEINLIKELVQVLKLDEKQYYSIINGKQFGRWSTELKRGFSFDFVLKEKFKIIEFFGDYWHCNPRFYDRNYFHKKMKCLAEEKWEQDKIKEDFIKKEGFEVFVVWEYDYDTDKETILNNCVKFLKS